MLAAANRSRKPTLPSLTPFDRHCFELAKCGQDYTQIATLMNCSPMEAEVAVLAVRKWIAGNSREMVEAAYNEQAMIAIQPAGKTLTEAQKAEILIEPPQFDKDGNLMSEAVYGPDHTTRIEAVRAAADLVEAVTDKSSSVNVNVGNQINVGADGGRSFEQRIRQKREQLGLGSGPPVIDAELAEEEDDDDAALTSEEEGELEEPGSPDALSDEDIDHEDDED